MTRALITGITGQDGSRLAHRLRDTAGPHQPNLLTDAADLIDRLTAELEAARAAALPCSVEGHGHDAGDDPSQPRSEP